MLRLSIVQGVTIVAIVAILVLGGWVHHALPRHDEQGTDTYFAFVDGQRLLAGENPYSRILAGNMRTNQKYTTYFPLFFLLGAATQKLGLADYAAWISVWRQILLLFNVGTGAVILVALHRRGLTLLGLFGTLFWFYNRWTLQITPVGAIDYIPIFFLVLSLALLPRHQTLSLVLLSVSLALKQLAIFVVPLYLIVIWQMHERSRVRHVLVAFALIASVPILTSLPFMVWDINGYVKSIVFSATRDAASHVNAPSVDGYAGWTGITARLPMVLLMTLAYVLAWRGTISTSTGALLTMVTFLSFNPVLFLQYFCWAVPLIPLAFAESVHPSLLSPRGPSPCPLQHSL